MEKPIFSDDVKFGYKQGNSLQKRLCLFTANWPLMPLHLFLYVGTDLVLPAGLPAKGQVKVRAPVGRTQLEKKRWKICNHPRAYLLHKITWFRLRGSPKSNIWPKASSSIRSDQLAQSFCPVGSWNAKAEPAQLLPLPGLKCLGHLMETLMLDIWTGLAETVALKSGAGSWDRVLGASNPHLFIWVLPWTCWVPSSKSLLALCLNFSSYKMGVIILTYPTGCCED